MFLQNHWSTNTAKHFIQIRRPLETAGFGAGRVGPGVAMTAGASLCIRTSPQQVRAPIEFPDTLRDPGHTHTRCSASPPDALDTSVPPRGRRFLTAARPRLGECTF